MRRSIQSILLILSAYITFSTAAYAKAGDVVLCYTPTTADTTYAALPKDSTDITAASALQQPTDSIKQFKKKSWFIRAYNFIDRLLSPPRDSNYIDVQNYNWCAELQVTSRFEQYEIDATSFHLKLSPQTRTRIGPFFGWRWAFLGYNFDLKSLFINSEDTDLGGSVYSAAFGIDAFYRRVGGNYKIRKLQSEGKDYSDLVKGKTFNGIHIGMSRLSFYYILNYKQYSHQAAFSQTNRQLRSAGSPIIGASYAHNRVTLDWEKLSATIGSAIQGYVPPKVFQTIKNDEFSVTGGYAYNWVFAKNWLAAGEMTGSLGYLVHHSDVEGDSSGSSSVFKQIDTFYRKNIAFNSNIRMSLLYNNGPWFAGTQTILFYYQYGNGAVMTRNLLGSVYVYVGCNF